MAKQCLIEKQKKAQAKYELLRQREKAILELPKEKQAEAFEELKAQRVKNRLYKTRQYNRCAITGRARGYIRFVGVCRQVFREKAHRGELPGITKASW